MINPDNNLILIKNEDKTENIETWTYSDGYYFITFCGGKTYRYNYQNVKIYKNPQAVDLQTTMILRNKTPLYAVKKVLIFQYHTKIFYENGYKETVVNQSLSFVQSALGMPKSKKCFDYLKELAIAVGLKDEDGKNILANRYNKIKFIREDCILSRYLSRQLEPSTDMKSHGIFPFGFNLSQKKAVENAMLNSLSVIEGPPGTGKTQTILNIIANAIMTGETVAIVSSNNSATQNVLDKLNKYGIGFIAAYLGNGSNKKEFIENQILELPNMEHWDLNQEQCRIINDELVMMAEQLDKMLETKNQLSVLKQEKEAILLEYKHYMNYYDETNHDDYEMLVKQGMKSTKLLELLVFLEGEKSIKDNMWSFIYCFIRFGLRSRKFLHNSPDRRIAICQKHFYEARIQELNSEIEGKDTILKDYDFEGEMATYSEKSLQILKANIAKKFKGQTRRASYDLDGLWKKSEQFVMDYPIILSTTYSLRSSLSSEFIYDYVIVDEASQVDLVTGALALSCAKKAVIVGDLKQLPNVVTKQVKERTNQIFESFNLDKGYCYASNSLLSSVTNLFPDVPHTLLREHYRCHPQIIEFCNQKFYKNELIILTECSNEQPPLTVYRTVKGNHKRDNINIRQVDVIEREVIPELKLDVTKDSIGIVTPYRNQTDYLQQRFKNTTVKADTVDKFQGQECDTVILSTVDDTITEFADDPNRLNVAISRAIKQLVVVTDGNNSSNQSNLKDLKDLIDYIEYNNFTLKDSRIYSIFDYLYKSYSEMRAKYLADKKRVSEYDSENLMYVLIQEVLDSKEEFEHLDVATHVPLRMLIRDLSLLDEKAIRYVMASGTHVDFAIYSRVSKKLILIIEVDGYQFHKEGTKQSERDKLKNTVLELYEIPYLRFATNGSGEKEMLTSKLTELLK